jgi:acetoin utilization protein AcuB
MQVKDVMATKVLTLNEHDSVANAEAKMRRAGVHQLVVTGARGRVVGVIGMGDVHDVPEHGSVADFMSRCLFTVRPDTTVSEAAALMRAHAIGSLPVLRGKRLVGIVTVSDMLALVDEGDRSVSSL